MGCNPDAAADDAADYERSIDPRAEILKGRFDAVAGSGCIIQASSANDYLKSS